MKPFASPFHVVGFSETSLKAILSKAELKIKEFRNFQCRTEFLKYKLLSKGYLLHLAFMPVDILALIIRKESYFETIVTKE